jgi:hypothetical protein
VRQPVRWAGRIGGARLTAAGILGREYPRQAVRLVALGLRNKDGGRFTVVEQARGPRHARPPARRPSTLAASEARLIITDDNANVSDLRSAAVISAEHTSASSSSRS